MIDMGLNGKTVIVTGANHGIGAAIALAFGCEGARILISYLRQPPELYGENQVNVENAKISGRAYYCREISRTADQAEWITGQVLQVGGGNRM